MGSHPANRSYRRHIPAAQRKLARQPQSFLAPVRPVAAHRNRISREVPANYNAPEQWHEPTGSNKVRYLVEPAGRDFVHPVTVDEIRARLQQLSPNYLSNLEVVQLSKMTRKRRVFPCYGMQWGKTVYLYPIEASLVETYVRPPKPAQIIEARMFGAIWAQAGNQWTLTWTESQIRDFYLNNVLIHEVGHLVDTWNSKFEDREKFANWFAIEYGYRASRGRRGIVPR